MLHHCGAEPIGLAFE